VDYAASDDFTAGIELADTGIVGIRDESNHIEATAANCPDTRMVLGRYSQGAVVTGCATAEDVPPGMSAMAVPDPMPPEIADHVAAVVLFGEPSAPFLQSYGAPAIVIDPRCAAKTIALCATGDTVCDGAPRAGAPSRTRCTP
jgi:cutinase